MPILYPFSKSDEAKLTAVKIGTKVAIGITRKDVPGSVIGQSLPVGTELKIWSVIYPAPDYVGALSGKRHIIYHKLDAGAWEKLLDKVVSGTSEFVYYMLAKAGVHTFYAEFPGDDQYEGCSEAVQAFVR